jgi:hypothetical protein
MFDNDDNEEKDFRALEEKFPEICVTALDEAREQALSEGQSVLLAIDEAIYEVFPDGSRKELKRIPPPLRVKKGSVFHRFPAPTPP